MFSNTVHSGVLIQLQTNEDLSSYQRFSDPSPVSRYSKRLTHRNSNVGNTIYFMCGYIIL